MTQFEIFRRHNGRYYYRVMADTGHNILSSDGYEKKKDCLEAIHSVKKKISGKGQVMVTKESPETWKFTIKGDGDWPLGYSMDFHSEKQCNNWIRLMQIYLPDANTIDLS